ncbi:MAG TPA: ferredoxin [Desulfotignum sp.]|nr:ferredoxin [Desulfotignum sp.]
MKRPAIDLGACILCEICAELAPHAFEISDSGFVQVKPLEDYQDDDIHEAIKNCPRDCIFWEDD